MDDNSVTINGVTIDFSPLLVNGTMFAVYCETEEDALIFLRCFKKKYPERCRTWDGNVEGFDKYERYCFRPNLNVSYGYLKYCSYEYYKEKGFVIIPFEDLIVSSTDIEESKLPIDTLFGGVT